MRACFSVLAVMNGFNPVVLVSDDTVDHGSMDELQMYGRFNRD